jgi:hypothetical protein
MALDERYQWVIDTDAGVTDVMGRERVLALGIANGRVILGIGIKDARGEIFMDTRAWVDMPDEIADQLGYHCHSAAETDRQQKRRS